MNILDLNKKIKLKILRELILELNLTPEEGLELYQDIQERIDWYTMEDLRDITTNVS